MKQGLFDNLKAYCSDNFYPFHMPGHKRNPQSGPLAEFYQYDITEIDGFDNLHQPETLIREAQERAAKLYHSKETYFLINGSTAGILSAISALAARANKLIISRNCHKAVYHAAFLNQMELHYVYPQRLDGYDIAGPVTKENIKREIEDILSKSRDDANQIEKSGALKGEAKDLIAGIVITSPTYDGIVSDVKEIARLVHSYGIPLVVDQAHGAHFGIHPSYPPNAVSEGADIVIHSVHKTLPAPTQTALLHRNGELIDGEIVRRYLRIYQSSSPSYLLMAGIDEAISLVEAEGNDRLDRLLFLRNTFLDEIKKCKYIQVCPLTEPGKLVISVKGFPMTGQRLYDILRGKYHLQMEMAAGSYVVAILTMMDQSEGIQRLLSALREIDANISSIQENGKPTPNASQSEESSKVAIEEEFSDVGNRKTDWWQTDLRPYVDLNLWDAYQKPFDEVVLEEAEGKTAAEFINLYPPGIPLLVPGERVEKRLIELVYAYLEHNYTVQGVCNKRIKVVTGKEVDIK